MPVQINEVIIKAVVEQQDAGQSSGSADTTAPAAFSEEALAEKILAMIKEKQER